MNIRKSQKEEGKRKSKLEGLGEQVKEVKEKRDAIIWTTSRRNQHKRLGKMQVLKNVQEDEEERPKQRGKTRHYM